MGSLNIKPSKQVMKDRYLVKFQKPTTIEFAKRVFDKLQIKFVRAIPKLNLFVIKSDKLGPLKKLFDMAITRYIEPDSIVYALNTPNDPLFSQQSGIERLQVPLVWDLTTGSKNVVIAVSDTGVSLTHEDLNGNIWYNMKEVPGNGVDDDNNGFIDDTNGWNFHANNNNPNDEQGHGSHVSGILGAEGDNGMGIAGINWNVSIMPVQFLGPDGSGSTSAGISTIIYAADNGARVLNASWGGPSASQALQDAIDYATSKGMLVVVAASNSSEDNDEDPAYPAAYPNAGMVTVASSQSNGSLSSFSNYGHISTDLAAPGSSILSSTPGNRYQRFNGTSMASPMVAGVAGLILSLYPDTDVIKLRNALFNGVDLYGSYQGKLATGGELNAQKAIEQFEDGFQVWPSRIAVKAGTNFQFSSHDGNGSVSWSVSDSSKGSISSNGVLSVSQDASGEVSVTATDSAGNSATTGVITIIAGAGSDTPIGGCSKSAEASDRTGSRNHEPIPLGLILLMGYALYRSRRISKKYS